VYRQPFIVGVMADKVLGFLAGMVANVLGVVATVVVMFMWAGSDPTPEVDARRQHAQSVSIWSGIGCFLPAILILAVLFLGVVMVAHGGGGGGPGEFYTPVTVP
jgi:hypothetical protein